MSTPQINLPEGHKPAPEVTPTVATTEVAAKEPAPPIVKVVNPQSGPRADFVPANWNVELSAEDENVIHARNCVSGSTFTGTRRQFSDMFKQ